RAAADRVLARALGVSLEPAGSALEVAGLAGCRNVDPPGGVLTSPPGGALVRASSSAVAISLRRFATQSFPIAAAPLGPGQVGLLRIPADGADRPWTIALRSRGPITVCGIGPGT